MIKERPTIAELDAILNDPNPPRVWIRPDGTVTDCDPDLPKVPWLDPSPEMLADPKFETIWQCIKTWDIHVPGAYGGYCVATGNHVRAILDALAGNSAGTLTEQVSPQATVSHESN